MQDRQGVKHREATRKGNNAGVKGRVLILALCILGYWSIEKTERRIQSPLNVALCVFQCQCGLLLRKDKSGLNS